MNTRYDIDGNAVCDGLLLRNEKTRQLMRNKYPLALHGQRLKLLVLRLAPRSPNATHKHSMYCVFFYCAVEDDKDLYNVAIHIDPIDWFASCRFCFSASLRPKRDLFTHSARRHSQSVCAADRLMWAYAVGYLLWIFLIPLQRLTCINAVERKAEWYSIFR